MLQAMLAELGEGCYVEPPFYANRGGRHVHLGSHVYVNFGLTCVDDTHIYIGDHTMIAPPGHAGHRRASHSARAAGAGISV